MKLSLQGLHVANTLVMTTKDVCENDQYRPWAGVGALRLVGFESKHTNTQVERTVENVLQGVGISSVVFPSA